jgi:hypothetical protein
MQPPMNADERGSWRKRESTVNFLFDVIGVYLRLSAVSGF